jgi:hypothetical protein
LIYPEINTFRWRLSIQARISDRRMSSTEFNSVLTQTQFESFRIWSTLHIYICLKIQQNLFRCLKRTERSLCGLYVAPFAGRWPCLCIPDACWAGPERLTWMTRDKQLAFINSQTWYGSLMRHKTIHHSLFIMWQHSPRPRKNFKLSSKYFFLDRNSLKERDAFFLKMRQNSVKIAYFL